MQVIALSPHEVRTRLAAEHGISACTEALSRDFLASVMRSQLARMYPCSPSALLMATRHALEGLMQDQDDLCNVAADVLEELQTCGDVVELTRVMGGEGDDRSHWLYPAPPSFVLRGRRVYLFGIAPDNSPFLPDEYWRRVQTKGSARFVDLGETDELNAKSLVAFGLRQLQEEEWLGAESDETAAQHVERLYERLQHQGINGHLPGMRALAHQQPDRLAYQRRWSLDITASGLHVVRVDQPYGAPLWYLADLKEGRCARSLLLPYYLERERACDQAWRAQLAIDASLGQPGGYSVQRGASGSALKLDFPIPLIARRRLQFVGGVVAQQNSPYVFVVSACDEQSERRYLEDHLWLREIAA